MSIAIYTDGACSGNGKINSVGGFGVVVVEYGTIPESGTIIQTYQKRCEGTTNNREELKAILWAFLNYGVKSNGEWENNIPIVYSDSNYCVQTFNEWMWNWARNGWVKSDKKTPENLDLIQTYYEWWNKGYRIDLRKIKGHAGHEFNEMADKLATGKMEAF